MKIFRSVIAMLVALSTVALTFCGCNKGNSGGDGSGEENKVCFDISEYKIVYSQKASEDIVKFTTVMRDLIEKEAGASLVASDDWHEDGEDIDSKKEILIGDTNRSASVAAKTELDAVKNNSAYIIKETGNKIIIAGKSDEITVRAIKQFVNSFVKTSAKEGTIALEKGFSAFGKADKSTVLLDNLVPISAARAPIPILSL